MGSLTLSLSPTSLSFRCREFFEERHARWKQPHLDMEIEFEFFTKAIALVKMEMSVHT